MTDDELLREARDDVEEILEGMIEERWHSPERIQHQRDLLARIDARLATGGWIQASERLPDSLENVLVSGGLAYYDGEAWISVAEGRPIQWEVTHWRPLPPPPKAKK
jgi:hypothetical protein